MKKFTAFTLSEVMITVGIIGVISALTVPTLVKNYQKQAQTVQLRKVISEIENAIDMLITEEGKTSLAATTIGTNNNGFDNFMRTHFKIVKTCAVNYKKGCFATEKYLTISGDDSKAFSCSKNAYVLANSAAICANKIKQVDVTIKKTNGGAFSTSTEKAYKNVNGVNIELYIDTNGAQGPNIGGRDMFHVYIQPDGRIYDEANSSDVVCQTDISGDKPFCLPLNTYEVTKTECKTSPFGEGCLSLLLDNNWKMNY